MAPKAKRSTVASRRRANDRNLARREAVKLLNGLALEVGLKAVKVKAAAPAVETLARLLEPRCQDDGRPERLRSAVASYLASGGAFSTPVLLTPALGTLAQGPEQPDVDGDVPPPILRHKLFERGFQLNSKAFMLMSNSRLFTEGTWPAFLAWVRDKRRSLGARRWAACLEESQHAAPPPGTTTARLRVFHAHAYLWWTDGQGLRRRNTNDLVFEGARPRVDVCTCHATKGRALRLAAAHGLWYVAVMKSGTAFAETNFVAWRDYVPRAEWLRSLWEAHKPTDAMYANYSAQLRSGHANRKRDLTELEADEKRRAVRDHVAKELARLNAAGVFQPLRPFPEADEFVKAFEDLKRCRRPILAVVGGTNLGKSVLAADVLRRVGEVLGLPEFSEVTVEDDDFLDLTDFDLRYHCGVLLDGIGDAAVLKKNREVLQGRPKACRAGRSPTMRFSTLYTLCRRAVVVTFDLSANNLHMLRTDHWLSNRKNVIQLHLTSPAWQAAATTPAPGPSCPRDEMASWTVAGVVAFAKAQDLAGPSAGLFSSGVNGADLLTLDERTLVDDVRLTPWGARKVLRARDAYLSGK